MILKLWKARAVRQAKAETYYRAIVKQTRRPEFYRSGGVADTFEGRFDLLVAHLALVLHRLKGEGAEEQAVAQKLLDLFFADMDAALRELGVGDTGVGRRVRHMSEAFYGRLEAYDAGLATDDAETLRAALVRNLYGSEAASGESAAMMAEYMREAARRLRQPALNGSDGPDPAALFPEPPGLRAAAPSEG